jgi:hypothetical protein
MTILIRNRPFMFSVFDRDGEFYLTAVAGGVALYDLTIKLTKEEVLAFQQDENKAIATAKDLITRTDAYQDRLVTPAIDPE